MNGPQLISFIKSNPSLQIWIREKPEVLEKSDIENVLGRKDLAGEYLDLLSVIDQLEVLGPAGLIHFHTFEEVQLTNDDPAYTSYLPFIFFFADDAGGRFYAFDPENQWGRGKNAIFIIPMGSLDKASARFLGTNLEELLVQLKAEKNFSKYPKIE
ncbi:MAG: hypothetical protein M3Q56_00565 [Bacteroidota bacterium]|nr:hypothetical protein [Bacteroidota bacterium]